MTLAEKLYQLAFPAYAIPFERLSASERAVFEGMEEVARTHVLAELRTRDDADKAALEASLNREAALLRILTTIGGYTTPEQQDALRASRAAQAERGRR